MKDINNSRYSIIIDEFPTLAIPVIAEILILGKKQGHPPNSWRELTPQEHALAAIGHLVNFLRGKTDEKHEQHALCRNAMLVDMIERQEVSK